MARLPDNTPSGSSLWDGVQDSWFDDDAGRTAAAPVGDAGTIALDEQPHKIDALRQAEADAAYLTKVHETQRAVAAAGNLDDLKSIESDWQAANAARAAAFADPRSGAQWAAEREIETGEAIAARRAEVTGQQRVDNVNAWLDGLQTSALRAGGDETAQLIDTGTRLIRGLTGAGHIDQATAEAMQRHWVQNYAKGWIEMRPAKERLALLGDAPAQDELGPDTGGAERGTANEVTHRTGTVADFLPSEDRERIRYEAQVELDRNTTQQTWQKAAQYEQSMADASRGDPKPPPWRAAIEADPDLDNLTRTRLLKQHDAMQQKLNAFWLAKAEYDKPDGRKFIISDDKDREFVDQIYTRLGGDMAALHAVVNRTGIMPDAAISDMKARLNSKDPAKAAQALSDLGRLTGSFRLLLALSGESADDLQNALSEFRYYRQSGTEDQAVKRFIEARTSNARTARDADQTGAHVDAAIIRATPGSYFYRIFGDNPAVTRTMIFAYRNLVKERYAETGDLNLAKAQADGHMKPLLDAAAEDAARKGAADRPTWIERAWLNGLDGYYRGTLRGAGQLKELAEISRYIEANPKKSREALLDRFYPGLKNSKWEENREARWQEIKSAPERYRKILADLARYDAMKGSDTVSEFGAAAGGQIVAGLLSPESYVGWGVKGASWGVRALKAALQQAGISGAIDPLVQKANIEAGVQSEYDPWRTFKTAAVGAVIGGGLRAGGDAIGGHLGAVPDGPPKPQVSTPELKIEEPVPVAPKSEGVTPQEGPAAPVPGANEPVHTPAGTSGQPGEVTRFDAFEFGGSDPSSNRKIVQGASDVHILREGALQRKPILENDLQRIAAGIDGAQFVSARVKDAPGLAEKVATGRPAHTIGDYLGGRISVESPAALKSAIDEISKTYRVLGIDDKIAKHQNGYRAVHVQVGLGNGMSAEIQLVPSEIAKVMDSTHGIYDKYKRLDKGRLIGDERAAYEKDMDRILSIHNGAWSEQERIGWSTLKKN